ncbi:hypothetical protein VNI00_005863 [Paramarasmius palmivorus]|uniref:Uncharacterized protein n=1 Tax=Paramarasmius palmivorus TaxID=297713 RepID=A0AAW0DDB0_9AGAR
MPLPGLNILARHGLDEGTGKLSPIYMGMIWTGIAAILAVARLGFWPYSINMLLVKRYSPASVLGSANGLLQFFICLSRAFGPITAR